MNKDNLFYRAWFEKDDNLIEHYVYFGIDNVPEFIKEANAIECYTGLDDIELNGIFENDIIEDVAGKRYIIEWCQDKLGFVARTSNSNDTLESLDITNYEHWKVIGNIRKNPELIKGM